MLIIEKTNSTPAVKLSIEKCIFEIKGLSFSNDVESFYAPIIEWIEKEFPKLECELECKLNLSVFNSVTYKYILNIMTKILHFNQEGKNIKVLWYFDVDDEDNRESAEDIAELFNIPFELIKNE